MVDVDMAEGVDEVIERIGHRRRFGIRVNQCRRDIAAVSHVPLPPLPPTPARMVAC